MVLLWQECEESETDGGGHRDRVLNKRAGEARRRGGERVAGARGAVHWTEANSGTSRELGERRSETGRQKPSLLSRSRPRRRSHPKSSHGHHPDSSFFSLLLFLLALLLPLFSRSCPLSLLRLATLSLPASSASFPPFSHLPLHSKQQAPAQQRHHQTQRSVHTQTSEE